MENDLKALLTFCPSVVGKSVLQLGSDAAFAQCLKNAGTGNFFEANDLKSINLNGQRVDLVVVSISLTNLSDQQVLDIIEAALVNLNVSGSLLFRESFFDLTDTQKQQRTPITLIDLVHSKDIAENSAQYGFDITFAKPNKSFSRNEASADCVSFLFSKIKLVATHGFKSLKEFMDHKQYSRNGVLRYEKIFGAGFVSTGGHDTTVQFFKDYDMGLKKGDKVLDVGCGIGGTDFLIAKTFDVEVLGMDLASNMVGIAWDRAQNFKHLNCYFEIGDIRKQTFPDDYFDCIYSRDTILHIDDKKSLFAQFKKWLKPGGTVFITDYCCGKKPWSDEFTAYVESRGYDLKTPQEYGQIFTDLGFGQVQADDTTDLFVESLRKELKRMQEIKDEFIREFSQEDFDYLVDGWNEKLIRTAAGHQKWGAFLCTK
jgi:phosphoethanolamine N-methyltransferase